MGRKQTIIIYPHLNDCGGDLAKQWYVEYSWRVPGNPKLFKERIYKGLQLQTVEARRLAAKKIIIEKTKWLKSGNYMHLNPTRVYEDELLYKQEAKLFGKEKIDRGNIRTCISDFCGEMKKQKTKSIYDDLKSKMRTFSAWLITRKYDAICVEYITKDHIIDFLRHLQNDEKYSCVTIKKYRQSISKFFEYMIEKKKATANPTLRMPKFGVKKDQAATPYQDQDRERLKELISGEDPWLWLACEIQFYCAIRPGTEIRLMKIGDIDFDNRQIKIPAPQAKNRTSEIVEIPDSLFAEMRDKYVLNKYPSHHYLFGKRGAPGRDPLGKNTMRYRFNKFRDKLKISSDHKFYSWKHTGAIALINAGAHPYDLKDHLRHKSFSTTEEYLKKRIKPKRVSTLSVTI